MISILGICAFLATFVFSSSIIQDDHKLVLNQKAPEKSGESIASRTSFVVTSIICLCVLSALLGYRIRVLDRSSFKILTLTQVYVLIQYLLSIGYVFSAAIIHNGIGLSTVGSCRAAMRLCLIFYAGSKVSMYLFLVERAHALRAPYMPRYRDHLWLLSTIGIFGSLGFIGIAGCVSPLAYLGEDDGRCRMGVRLYTAIPLMTSDIVINIFLTLIFVYLLSPLVRGSQSSGRGFASRLAEEIGDICGRAKRNKAINLRRTNQVMTQKVEKLLWKTFIGCVLVVVPTAGNLVSLCILVGKELAFICLTVCSFDVTWAAVVFHWLTMAGADEKEADHAVSTGRHDEGQAQVRPIQPAPAAMRRKVSDTLATFDMDTINNVQGAPGESGVNQGYAETRSSPRLSIHSATSRWKDSGHTTLVVDSDANKSTV